MDAELQRAIAETEMSIIGCVLIQSDGGNTTVINELRDLLRPQDFFFERNRKIYSVMLATHLPPNIEVVKAALHEKGLLVSGDISHMVKCELQTPCSLDYDYYAQALKAYWDNPNINSQVRGAL